MQRFEASSVEPLVTPTPECIMTDSRLPHEEPATLEASDARGAQPGVPVLWVLVISTVVALVAVIVIWSTFFHQFSADQQPTVKPPAPIHTAP
jgi:hypothetical protein